MKTPDKYFTFLVIFIHPATGNTTSACFCEKEESDVFVSFKNYCTSRGMKALPKILGLTLIYCKSDHEKYGEYYGFPEEYAA